MNWDIVKGKWKQFAGTAQSNWGKLTNDEVDEIEGDREALIGKLQEHYGYARSEAEDEIDEWASSLKAKV
jgi:uncharacterized protein YjbJ (UPF0337 family)